jgi:XTP/dITP diphosphohydrolase
MKLIFATNNQHKVEEMQAAIGEGLEIVTLKQAGIEIEIPEPYDTLEANAAGKSRTIRQLTGMDCFSEDTGLEVTALKGDPGVKSARYAGEDKSFEKNIEKLLFNLKDEPDKSARFRTVISLLLGDKEYFFEGTCDGEIIPERKGASGFGYDPVFIPVGSDRSFAEMTMDEKNGYSHRKKAADKLLAFLKIYRGSEPFAEPHRKR